MLWAVTQTFVEDVFVFQKLSSPSSVLFGLRSHHMFSLMFENAQNNPPTNYLQRAVKYKPEVECKMELAFSFWQTLYKLKMQMQTEPFCIWIWDTTVCQLISNKNEMAVCIFMQIMATFSQAWFVKWRARYRFAQGCPVEFRFILSCCGQQSDPALRSDLPYWWREIADVIYGWKKYVNLYS